ncbi:MAG: DNA polymerase III subunit beta [Candidatus Omnitrophota bacterium]|nr:MAG: DNA polymerase III subunit beta [Candidatus Omnitrophota bacterium]
MRFRCKRSVLREGIQRVSNVINPRATLPILSNILVEVEKEGIKFSGTDLEIGISALVKGEIEVEEIGAITVPAKKISDIVHELPDEKIDISVKKNNILQIEAGKVFYRIMGLPAGDFPQLPSLPEENREKISLSQPVLKSLLTMTAFAVSSEESRYVLNGILFVHKEGKLRLVSTDGRRLALVEKEVEGVKGELWKRGVILPIKAVKEVNRLLGEGEIEIYLIENQMVFVIDNTVVISRLIEGEFPDYEQVIPQRSSRIAKINREGFLSATRRVSLLTAPSASLMKLNLNKNRLLISSETPDLGEAREEMEVEYQGEEITIGFNPYYLLDMLRSIPFEEIELGLEESEKPGVFKAENFTCILMPIQISQ